MKPVHRHRRPPALGLAFAASLLELGPAMMLLRQDAGLPLLLAATLAYQVGNGLPRVPSPAGRRAMALAAIAGSAQFVSGSAGSVPWLLGISLMSWGIQSIRRALTAVEGPDLPTTAQKRCARVIGFALAGPAPPDVWLALAMSIAMMAWLSMPASDPGDPPLGTGYGHPIEWTMLVHQIHYFIYAGAMPLLVMHPTSGGVSFAGVWFACGWISYLFAEILWRRFSPRPVFITGHLFLTCVLLCFAAVSSIPATILLWILSGFGGGTVYCLTLLHRRQGLPPVRLERTEDLGHVLGVTLALAGTHFLDWRASTLPVIGGAWAFAAAMFMAATWITEVRRETGRENAEVPKCG